jgi:benzoyl-CoA 2,3-dioxygenase component A
MTLFFGARAPHSLPYFGPLAKVPETLLKKHFAFSRIPGEAKHYVQDRMRAEAAMLAATLSDERTHIYVCGLKAMETGVEAAFADIARGAGLDWVTIRAAMREDGRYHVETY